jgi:hypothetical protein
MAVSIPRCKDLPTDASLCAGHLFMHGRAQ